MLKARSFGRIVLAVSLIAASVGILQVGAQAAKARCFGEQVTIKAKAGAVTKGTSRSDVIVGTAGPDVIKGGGGDDLICGRSGKDELKGGRGFDQIDGAGGDDVLNGNAGEEDYLIGGPGDDTLNGGPGVFPGTASYEDSPVGVVASLEDGTAVGNGNDTLVNISSLRDSPFDDQLVGSPGPGDGFFVSQGNDIVDGNGGEFDAAFFLFVPGPVDVDLLGQAATADGLAVEMENIQDVVGSPFNDTITGNHFPNFLWGHGGDDTVSGLQEDDFIEVPFGNDIVNGGQDVDTAAFGNAQGPATVDLQTSTASVASSPAETPTIQEFENSFGSFEFGDVLNGTDGSNAIVGLGGSDQITGLGQDDFLDGDYFDAGATFPGNDSIDGGDGIDTCVNGEDETNCEEAPARRQMKRAWRFYLRYLR